MSQSLLLQAFQGTNKTIPVWFMRQAGRTLPQYQALKSKYPLEEMFHNPEIASEISCLPVKELNVDAAILFADILTLPASMGFKISFSQNNGPVITNPIAQPDDLGAIHDFYEEELNYVRETIRLVKQRLPTDIPLIGFAGSPFSVAFYLVGGGSPMNFSRIFHLMFHEPEAFHRLMEILTRNTMRYLNLQKDAGIKVFQLFDTWAGALRPTDYAHWVLPYVREIFDEVDLPSIYYLKNCQHLLALMEKCGADFLSVCESVVLGHNPILAKTDKGVQGNLFIGLLYAPRDLLEKEIRDVLMGGRHYQRYIFNLSHGVFPDVEVDTLKFVVDRVHGFGKMGTAPIFPKSIFL